MKIKKIVEPEVHAHPQSHTRLLFDERKFFIDFFALLLEWDQQENVAKGQIHAEPDKRNPNNSH